MSFDSFKFCNCFQKEWLIQCMNHDTLYFTFWLYDSELFASIDFEIKIDESLTAFTHEINLFEFLKYIIFCRGELQICQDCWEDKRIKSRINQIVVANIFKSHAVTASHEKLTTSSSWQIFPFAARKKTKKRRTCSANKKESFF